MKKKQILGLINDKLSKIVDIIDKKNIIEYPWTPYDQKQLNDLIEESDRAISVTISGTPETGMQIEKGKSLSNFMPGKADNSFIYNSNKPWYNEDGNKESLEKLSNELNESKYYIPSIEEFCVGFECEILSSYDWQKGTWPNILFEDTLTGFETERKGEVNATKNASLRVKYLDKEDIESLGFIKSDKLPISYETEDWFIYKASEAYGSNNWLIQLRQGGNIFDKFSGTIKNKSELIKILKAIGYNEQDI